jgi:hypothetical protein
MRSDEERDSCIDNLLARLQTLEQEVARLKGAAVPEPPVIEAMPEIVNASDEPVAWQSRDDLAEILAKQNPDAILVAMLGETRPNGHLAGNRARLPFTERYKLPLYAAVALAIAMLVFVQYRVLRQVKRKPEGTSSDRPFDEQQ